MPLLPLRRPPGRRFPPFAAAAALGAAVLVGACGGPTSLGPGVECTVLVAPAAAPDPVTPDDTLDVIVQLPERSTPVEALVRVDSVGREGGLVVFPSDVPETAAGVGATLTTRAVYSVCVSSAPRAVVFRGEEPRHDKVWVRVSSNRTVRTVVRIGAATATSVGPPFVVVPGASGRRSWTPAGDES